MKAMPDNEAFQDASGRLQKCRIADVVTHGLGASLKSTPRVRSIRQNRRHTEMASGKTEGETCGIGRVFGESNECKFVVLPRCHLTKCRVTTLRHSHVHVWTEEQQRLS